MDWLIEQLGKEWAVIRQVPVSAVITVVVCFLLAFLVNRWIYGERIDRATVLMNYYKKERSLSSKTPAQVDTLASAWKATNKTPVIGKSFVNQEVPLDGFSYSDCTFRNVTLVFNGDAPFDLTNNTIEGVYIRSANPALNGLIQLLIELKMIDPRIRIER